MNLTLQAIEKALKQAGIPNLYHPHPNPQLAIYPIGPQTPKTTYIATITTHQATITINTYLYKHLKNDYFKVRDILKQLGHQPKYELADPKLIPKLTNRIKQIQTLTHTATSNDNPTHNLAKKQKPSEVPLPQARNSIRLLTAALLDIGLFTLLAQIIK